MIRRHFHDLPVEARQAIADKAGPVHAARTADGGLNSGIATFLDTDHGPVFVKGIDVAVVTAVGRLKQIDGFCPELNAPQQ